MQKTHLVEKKAALELLFQRWNPTQQREYVSLENSLHRILAENQYSENTLPVFRSSSADGVAVRGSDFIAGQPDTQAWIEGRDFVRADTGDDFSDEFDTIIRIEDVSFDENGHLQLNTEVHPGQNVSARGSSLCQGDLLMEAYQPIRATDLAALVMGGKTHLPVISKPKVAFIPTGSELVPAGSIPRRGQNINTNSHMICCLLQELGAEPHCFPIVRDELDSLRAVLARALTIADLVIINGGSSKGEEDFNVRILREHGEVLCHRVAAAPGMPLALALVEEKPVIVMPGPPLGAFNCAEWCLKPIISCFLGVPVAKRRHIRGRLLQDMHCPEHMEFMARVDVFRDGMEYCIQPHNFRAESASSCLASNAFFFSPIGESDYPAGTEIEVSMLRGDEYIRPLRTESSPHLY